MTSTSDATVETSEEDLAALLDDAGVTDDMDDTFNDTDDELSDKPTQVWTSNRAVHGFNIVPPESKLMQFSQPNRSLDPLA